MAIGEEKLKTNLFVRTLSIILISFILLPLITMGIMYFSNEGFKDSANKILSALPGGMGSYFQSIPTMDEREQLKKDIAKYYVTFDESRIVDKLLIIKGEDDQLYNDLIVLMSKVDSSKMKKVKENLRISQFKKDPFNRILTEIDKDSEEKINEMQKYYSSLNLEQAIQEIRRTYASNEVTIEQLASLFGKLKPDQASKYLFYLDTELERLIKFKLPKEALRNIEKKLKELEQKQNKTLELASIYENKPIKEAVAELENIKTYNIEELAIIFKELTLNKSSKILSEIDDNDFMLTLFNEISHLEALQNDRLGTLSAMIKGMTIYKQHDTKINELAAIYQKTDINELTNMIETMLRRNEVYQEHTLNDFDEIIFSEEQLVIDVLNKLKTNTVAEILKRLNEKDRISLSKKLLK